MMSDLEHRHMDTQIKPNMHSSVRNSEQKAKHSFRGDSFSSIKLVTYGKKKGQGNSENRTNEAEKSFKTLVGCVQKKAEYNKFQPSAK